MNTQNWDSGDVKERTQSYFMCRVIFLRKVLYAWCLAGLKHGWRLTWLRDSTSISASSRCQTISRLTSQPSPLACVVGQEPGAVYHSNSHTFSAWHPSPQPPPPDSAHVHTNLHPFWKILFCSDGFKNHYFYCVFY